jgi:integrase/recombinase XerD
MAELSPLRRRMIEDMSVRNLAPTTQQSYLHHVAKFSGYFGRSPERLGLAEVRDYQVHLVSQRVSWGGLNRTHSQWAAGWRIETISARGRNGALGQAA